MKSRKLNQKTSIMNTPHFALLIGTLLMISCAKPNQQNVKESEMTISGLATAIINGKDGYTATIETKEKKTYTAIVSIPNLGKDGGYQRIIIGDEATLQGKVLPSDEHQLIVTKIIDVEKALPIIKEHSFRGMSPGDKIADHQSYIQADQLKSGEGAFDIYQIQGYNEETLGFFLPDPNDKTLIGNIIINTPSPKTAQNIHVGNTFAQLRKALPELSIHGSEIEGRTFAKSGNLSYRLDAAHFTYEVDIAKISAKTKILEIIVNR